jgi:hypothetical protein
MPVVSKTRFLMRVSFSRIARTLCASDGAPQPPMPDVSIRQIFSVGRSAFRSAGASVCAMAGNANARHEAKASKCLLMS